MTLTVLNVLNLHSQHPCLIRVCVTWSKSDSFVKHLKPDAVYILQLYGICMGPHTAFVCVDSHKKKMLIISLNSINQLVPLMEVGRVA